MPSLVCRFGPLAATRYCNQSLEGFLGNRFREGHDDLYLLQRVRLGMRLQPLSWASVFVEGQDARVFMTDRVAAAPPFQDAADLRQAYLQFGSADHGPLDFRVGRQELAFGEERLLGAGNWGNVARSFDAIRMGLHSGDSRVDVFTASVVVPVDHTLDHHIQGDNIHGIYAHFGNWIPSAAVEPYAFWRVAPTVSNEAGLRGKLNTRTFGIRLAGRLPQRFEYTTEMVAQSGSWSHDDVRAWAAFWRLGRELSSIPFRPVLRLEANHASGDSRPADGRRGTFDVLYPTPHDKYGMTDQVGWKNINHVSLIAEVKPRRTLVLQAKVHDWWLASATDALYSAGGALLVRDVSGNAGRHIGEEIDFQAIWTPHNKLSFAGGIGHLFPGEFIRNTTPGQSYTFPYVQLVYGL